ncbi:10256_t:CDS:2, partial [Gigaspora rosea]
QSYQISDLSHFNCSEIKPGSKWNRQKIESAGFVTDDLETNGLLESIIFCVGEAVETTLSNDGQPVFGIVKGIIEHKWNNDQICVFIYLEWLKYLNKFDDLLGCPIYCLQ